MNTTEPTTPPDGATLAGAGAILGSQWGVAMRRLVERVEELERQLDELAKERKPAKR